MTNVFDIREKDKLVNYVEGIPRSGGLCDLMFRFPQETKINVFQGVQAHYKKEDLVCKGLVRQANGLDDFSCKMAGLVSVDEETLDYCCKCVYGKTFKLKS
jgi:hypothetical protein